MYMIKKIFADKKHLCIIFDRKNRIIKTFYIRSLFKKKKVYKKMSGFNKKNRHKNIITYKCFVPVLVLILVFQNKK